MKILLGKSQIALRKCKQGNQTITAGQLKQQGGLERRIHHDKGYKFLRALRGSSPYFGDILHVFYIFYMSAAMYGRIYGIATVAHATVRIWRENCN